MRMSLRPLAFLLSMAALVQCSGGGASRSLPQSVSVGGGSSRHAMSGSVCNQYPDMSVAVLDSFHGKIYFYTPSSGSYSLSATITLPGTAGNTNGRMVFDADGDLWVAYSDTYHSPTTAAVVEYTAPLTTGQSPAATISGSNTGFASPLGITYNASTNMIFVSDYTGNSISAFSSSASGNVAPTRTISGSSTNLNAPTELRSDANYVYAANAGSTTGSITEYGLSASGNVAPSVSLSLSGLTGSQVTGFGFTSSGDLFAVGNAQGPVGFWTLSGGFSGSPAAHRSGYSVGNMADVATDDQGNFWTIDQTSTVYIYSPNVNSVSWSNAPISISTASSNLGALAVFSPGKLTAPFPN